MCGYPQKRRVIQLVLAFLILAGFGTACGKPPIPSKLVQEDYKWFRLYLMSNSYYAGFSKTVGPYEPNSIQKEKIYKDWKNKNLVVEATTIEALKARIDALPTSKGPTGSPQEPKGVQDGYKNYNLMILPTGVYAGFAQSIGAFNPSSIQNDPVYEQWRKHGLCIEGSSLENLKSNIDTWVQYNATGQ